MLYLVIVDEVLELVGVHDDVEAAHLRQPELCIVDAGEADLLPRARAVGLPRAVHGALGKVQFELMSWSNCDHCQPIPGTPSSAPT